jgi:hypothetical protein
MAKSYNIADILDKTLVVKVNTNARSFPSLKAPILKTFKAGDIAGNPYTYVVRDGVAWLSFDDSILGKPYYISSEAISNENFKDQEIKTTEQKAKEKAELEAEKNKDFFDRIFEVLINVVLLVLSAYIINGIIQKKL